MPSVNSHRQGNDAASSSDACPQVTITLTRFNEPDWLLDEALTSLAKQSGVCAEVLVLDQTPSDAIAARCAELQSSMVRFRYETIPARGLSFARNQAIEKATHDVVLYIDADAVAEPRWARSLQDALVMDDVGLAGARIVPKWHRAPLLIARSLMVQDQYSILDLGSATRSVHRVVGAGFGLHRRRLKGDAYFDERLGRRAGTLLGGEESDLSRRVIARGLTILYVGKAVVHHQILRERIRYRWIMRRLYYAGFGRAVLGGAPNPSKPMATWDYLVLPVVLPVYAAGFLRGKLQAFGHQVPQEPDESPNNR